MLVYVEGRNAFVAVLRKIACFLGHVLSDYSFSVILLIACCCSFYYLLPANSHISECRQR